MRYKFRTERSISRSLTAATMVIALALGLASPAHAIDLVSNKKCRAAVATKLSAVAKRGMQSQEKCYGLAGKAGVESSICLDTETFPFAIIDGGGYLKTQAAAESALLTKIPTHACDGITAAETLDNYPNDSTSETYPNFDELLRDSAEFSLGTSDLGGDLVLIGCQKAIGMVRRGIATRVLGEIAKCQKTVDAAAAVAADFGGLSRTPTDCLVPSAATLTFVTGQEAKIALKCGTAPTAIPGYPSGDSVGACSPLPSCVSDKALALGKNLALAEYPSQNCPNVLTPAGRTVTVALSSGVALGGANVLLEYPRFQAGIPNNGAASEVQSAIVTPNFFSATDRDGAVEVDELFSPALAAPGGTAFQVKLDKCEDFSKGLCSVTTAAICGQNKDCSSHCLEVAEGGTAGNTNTPCAFDSDCPATGPVPGLLQKCNCPTCSVKHCVGPNANPLSNATCNFNQDCSSRCSNNLYAQTGAGCVFSSQCGAGNTCDPDKACSQYVRSVCTSNNDCNGTNVPTCTAGKCSAGPVKGNACSINSDCAVGHCSALNSLHVARACTVANQNLDCGGHCSVTTAQGCSASSQCPGVESCNFGTCDTSSPITGLCNVGDPATGGGFCVATESCIAQDSHCSVSQYLGCGKPGDPACPAGEDCTTQGALTKCTVLDAFDEFANEVDGVSCSVGVTEP